MKILITGLPLFSKALAESLKDVYSDHSFIFYDTYNSNFEQLKYAGALPFADLVLSMNGVSDPSGSLDLAVKLRKKLWMQWQGTDVLLATMRAGDQKINRKYIDYAVHFTDAPWLATELNSIGIYPEILHFKWLHCENTSGPFSSLAAYTYMSQGKEPFYGWNELKSLAENHPDVVFTIAGSDGAGLKKLPNTRFLGWISNEKMREIRESTPVFIRFTLHDGYSYSVLEALSAGNEVLWSMPHPNCHLITANNINGIFSSVVEKLETGGLQRNTENRLFIQQNFSKEDILGRFVNRIKQEIG